MCRYNRNDISRLGQEQSARQARYTRAGGNQLVICSYRQLIIATSSRELTLAQRHAVCPLLP